MNQERRYLVRGVGTSPGMEKAYELIVLAYDAADALVQANMRAKAEADGWIPHRLVRYETVEPAPLPRPALPSEPVPA